MPSPKPYVAVVGSGEAGEATCALARDLGREVARRGAVVVCGGLGGVMEAACRGAKEEGGTTLGILPPGDDRRAANPFVDVAVATGLGEVRNALVARTADVVVAVAGEFGTLSEIALALRMGKPVVGLSTWELARGGRPVEAILRASSAVEAAELALAQLTARSTTREDGSR